MPSRGAPRTPQVDVAREPRGTATLPWAVVAMLAPALVLALTACESTTSLDRTTEPAIRTDAAAYEVDAGPEAWSVEIPYTFTNRTDAAVYLAHCNDAVELRLDRWHDGDWVEVWSPKMPLCLSVPVPIEAGETFPDTVHFVAGRPGSDVWPQLPVDDIDGTYRLVWTGIVADYETTTGGVTVPLAHRTSNPFELRD